MERIVTDNSHLTGQSKPCNCVRDNEARLAEHYSKQLGIPAKAEAKNVAIVFGKGLSERPYLPYAIKADKPGWRSAKGKEISMFFNFCPFCGVSTAEQKEGAMQSAVEETA